MVRTRKAVTIRQVNEDLAKKIAAPAANVLNQAGEAMQAAADVVAATAAPKKPRRKPRSTKLDFSNYNIEQLRWVCYQKNIPYAETDDVKQLISRIRYYANTGHRRPVKPPKQRKLTKSGKERSPRKDKGQKKGELKKDGTPRKKPGPKKGYKRRTKN